MDFPAQSQKFDEMNPSMGSEFPVDKKEEGESRDKCQTEDQEETLLKPRAFTPEDFCPKMVTHTVCDHTSDTGKDHVSHASKASPDFKSQAPSSIDTTAIAEVASPQRPPRSKMTTASGYPGESADCSPLPRAKLAQSFDSAKITECLAGFDVDHIVRCSAVAIQNDIILSLKKAHPHSATPEMTKACSVFLEPMHHEKLKMRRQATQSASSDPIVGKTEHGEQSSRDFTPAAAPSDMLNDIAVRRPPTPGPSTHSSEMQWWASGSNLR